MPFIAKNPLNIPEVETPPSLPMPGTRGLFAREDGWYDIDSDGIVQKIALSGETPGGDTPSDKDIQGLIEELNELKEIVEMLYAKSLVKTITITLPSSAWVVDSDNHYSQVVTIEGVTQYSKIDLQPTPEQLTIFHEKDITFVTENDDGVITVYCIGQKPLSDYVIQATITEVEVDE